MLLAGESRRRARACEPSANSVSQPRSKIADLIKFRDFRSTFSDLSHCDPGHRILTRGQAGRHQFKSTDPSSRLLTHAQDKQTVYTHDPGHRILTWGQAGRHHFKSTDPRTQQMVHVHSQTGRSTVVGTYFRTLTHRGRHRTGRICTTRAERNGGDTCVTRPASTS